jgi:hypothetical protein
MNKSLEVHERNGILIAEIISGEVLIRNIQDGVDLMGELYFQGYDRIIIREMNITPEFFNLKNGIAGEILQKFSNYRMRLSIIGDFSRYTRQSIRDFIFESNTLGRITFVGTLEEATDRLSA